MPINPKARRAHAALSTFHAGQDGGLAGIEAKVGLSVNNYLRLRAFPMIYKQSWRVQSGGHSGFPHQVFF